ncbi:MAG: voltage-gated potassium channel [Actinomycetota bacterium]
MRPLRRLWLGLGALALITVAGTVGYTLLGFGVLDAIYQTVATVTTVGFRHPSGGGQTVFTLVLIVVGVGTALYTFSVLIEAFVEGEIGNVVGRRRMERTINEMKDHVVICGWGRVGQALAHYVTGAGQRVVIVDQDGERLERCPHPTVHGNATDDDVLRAAGIGRARVLAAALTTDSDNLYVTMSGRALSPEVFIIARARVDSSEDKLVRAGANRVVNPQSIGGARMAAFALQPHVAEFLDVVMHDGSMEFRLEEILVPFGSALEGKSLRDAHLRDLTGALVLAIRDDRSGKFTTNPDPESSIEAGQILIAIGTSAQLAALQDAVKR